MSYSASPLHENSEQHANKHTDQADTEDRPQSLTKNSESEQNTGSFEDDSKTDEYPDDNNTETASPVRLETPETKQTGEGLPITVNKSNEEFGSHLSTGRTSKNETKSERNSDFVTTTNQSEKKTKSNKSESVTKTYEKRDLRFEENTEDKTPKGKTGYKKKEERNTKIKNVINNVTPSQGYEDRTESRYTDSETTGGKSSIESKTPRSQRKRVAKKSNDSIKSPRSTKSNKSILKPENTKKTREPLSFMASLVGERTIYHQPTRVSNDSRSVVTLPALNSQTEINKVYVDDTEKLASQFPKRDKNFKLEFVYDIKQKYPSWYNPEKKLSHREKKAFKNINGVYADYKTHDEREETNTKKMEERIRQVEKLKEEEAREKRSKKLESALEQYDQLKEVREKFEILSWYRNQTQYITPRVLEHEKLSRHVYGLPESLQKRQQLIKNLKRKNKKQTRHSKGRIKSV